MSEQNFYHILMAKLPDPADVRKKLDRYGSDEQLALAGQCR